MKIDLLLNSIRLFLWFLVPLNFATATLADPELPGVSVTAAGENILLNWPTVEGQRYSVERGLRPDDSSWQTMTPEIEATGEPMSYGEARSGQAMFYRISVAPENFQPESLSPLWQLDAEADFSGLAEGATVAQWIGSGIASDTQVTGSQRPRLTNGSVAFDGVDDVLSLPMWEGGVGTEWTLAVLFKVGKGIKNEDLLFGGSNAANRALEFSYHESGIWRWWPDWSALINQDQGVLPANENWHVMLFRSDGTNTLTTLDWFHGVEPSLSAVTGKSGSFNLGAGYDAPSKSAPVSIRYMGFFPRCLSDAEAGQMTRWMERRKDGEYPPVALFYGGGQSNYGRTKEDIRRAMTANFDNPAFALGGMYEGRPLSMWMRDNDAGTGYEVCPLYDLSAAPVGSGAFYQIGGHSGTKVLSDWKQRAAAVAKNPNQMAACIFVQGESDSNDARFTWKPNGNGDYNEVYPKADALATSYGARSAAWNSAIRESAGQPGMYFIYERIWYTPGTPGHTVDDLDRTYTQRLSLLESLKNDPRCLLVETEDLPRLDGVHLTDPGYVPDQSPETGAERFSRSAARLLKRAERLSHLSYDGRMVAMRAIDSGLELDDSGIAACESFAAADDFHQLRSLVIPTLPALRAVDQATLRRCNLVAHLGGKYATGFVATAPDTCTATFVSGANPSKLEVGIRALLDAWNVSGAVSLSAVAP